MMIIEGPDETRRMIFQSLEQAAHHPEFGEEWVLELLEQGINKYNFDRILYKPSPELKQRIEEYKIWCQTQEGENAGHLMEEIALLAFKCLKGYSQIKSFQSYTAQYDLVISGIGIFWNRIIQFIKPACQRLTIVVEAKNHSQRIDDQIFSRLCSVLQNCFEDTSEIGVFFTRMGATGFPERNDTNRQRELRDSQATQIIFHAKTNKSVVVFNHDDILKLVEPGSLLHILEAKIRAVEQWTGLPVKFEGEWQEIDLPEHLSKYF